jgi:hypothetical protein
LRYCLLRPHSQALPGEVHVAPAKGQPLALAQPDEAAEGRQDLPPGEGAGIQQLAKLVQAHIVSVRPNRWYAAGEAVKRVIEDRVVIDRPVEHRSRVPHVLCQAVRAELVELALVELRHFALGQGPLEVAGIEAVDLVQPAYPAELALQVPGGALVQLEGAGRELRLPRCDVRVQELSQVRYAPGTDHAGFLSKPRLLRLRTARGVR